MKMSKSLGNVIDPYEIVKEYSTDSLRYFLLRHIHPFEDSEFTTLKFKEAYNANLANGLGNLVSRIMKMSSDYGVTANLANREEILGSEWAGTVFDYLEKYDYNSALDEVWSEIQNLDAYIGVKKPFHLIKDNVAEAKKVVATLVEGLWRIAVVLEPFLPETSEHIQDLVNRNAVPKKPLFLRRD
jgi:methionyl-tRNA synthetase